MRIPRIYQAVPLSVGALVDLEPQAAAHLMRVLRLHPGDELVLFNGAGGEYRARVAEAGRRGARVEVIEFTPCSLESPLDVTLVQGVSRGERMDYTVQKAVEMGVTRIVPVITERTVVHIKGERQEKRCAHWQAIVNGACEQSGRNTVPHVAPMQPLHAWLASDTSAALRLVLHHRAQAGLKRRPPPSSPVILLIGPEGGLSPAEIEATQAAGYAPLRLGPRVLRTETAALAALAVLQWQWGDWGPVISQ